MWETLNFGGFFQSREKKSKKMFWETLCGNVRTTPVVVHSRNLFQEHMKPVFVYFLEPTFSGTYELGFVRSRKKKGFGERTKTCVRTFPKPPFWECMSSLTTSVRTFSSKEFHETWVHTFPREELQERTIHGIGLNWFCNT